MEWSRQTYNKQYENWVPWAEDKYLSWFTNDNKASYATKDSLSNTKVTGNEQVDKAQDGVNNMVGGQVGKGGLLQPAGDAASKEGVNRMERGGKDDKGSYGGAASSMTDPMINKGKDAGNGTSSYYNSASESVKGAGSYVSSFWGGGKKEEKK